MINAPNVQEWLSMISWLYFGFAAICAGIAWKLATRRRNKIIAAAVVVGLFLSWPIADVVSRVREQSAFKARYDAAAARFEERCKEAGEKIVRTVDDVDGILILKMRISKDIGDGIKQLAPSAAFYHESTEDEYLTSFLWYEEQTAGQRGRLTTRRTDYPGYAYVDFVDSTDGQRYRYRLVRKSLGDRPGESMFALQRAVASDPPPRYGVTFEDMVDASDRMHWIAGSIVKVVDLISNEELARHTRLAFDRGLGSRGGARTPWASPLYCPVIGPSYVSQTRHFVDRVLRPRK